MFMYAFHRRSKLFISDYSRVDPRHMHFNELDGTTDKDYIHFVYVLRLNNGVIKVGHSSTFGSRVSALKQKFKDSDITFVHLFKIITKDLDISKLQAVSLENYILSLCKNHSYHKHNKNYLNTIKSTEISFEYCFTEILDDLLSYINFICKDDLRITFYPCYKMCCFSFHEMYKACDLDTYKSESFDRAIDNGIRRKELMAA